VATTALTTPPSLGPLYAKAGLLGQLHRGDSLPESVYTLADQTIDADHLVAYQKVCGFRVTDELPPTYLHMLAFPVSVALMTESAFPFPLIGMVHVANSITVARTVRSDETVSFTVQAANLRPHPAGRQLDLLAEATIDSETVWTSRSTYLRRGGAPKDKPGADEKSAKRSAKPDAAQPSGQVSVVRVPDDIGRRYGSVSGDRNPIHLYGLTAKLFGFPSAIAHGMWLKARTLATLEGRLPDSFAVDVTFKTPVLLPSTIGISATQRDHAWALDVRNVRNGKPHLSGTVN
jgi:acyl dehydratase